MAELKQYAPGHAYGAKVLKDGDMWTLVLVRELRHSPEKVWRAITEPVHLREWAPFEPDGNLSKVGDTISFSTVASPKPHVIQSKVTRAEAPKLLEYTWGEYDTRWELEPAGQGTRLTLWTRLDRRYISMGAAGWHICFDVLDHLLAGTPIGRIAGGDAVHLEGWKRLNAEYAEQFAAEE